MKDHSEIGIVEETARYEAWLAERIPLVKADLEHKHRTMSAGIFPFLRATFYRWAARWRAIASDMAAAPTVLAVARDRERATWPRLPRCWPSVTSTWRTSAPGAM